LASNQRIPQKPIDHHHPNKSTAALEFKPLMKSPKSMAVGGDTGTNGTLDFSGVANKLRDYYFILIYYSESRSK
jgi:hypothetical protein